MPTNIGLLATDHDNKYYDITHTFQIDSFTYHVLGLRKDRPTYGSTYYIFSCPDCTEERYGIARATPRSLPVLRTSGNFEHRLTSEHRTILKHHSSSTNQVHITTSRTDRPHTSSATRKKVENGTISIEQSIAKLLQTEHQTLVTSLRKAIKADNEALIRSIKNSSKKVEDEKQSAEQKLNETLKNERQSMLDSFRQELEAKNTTLIQSIKTEEQVLIQESAKSMISKEEIVLLFEEQKRSLESIYEKQNRTIDSSDDRFIQNVTEVTNTQQVLSTALNHFQITLIQTVEKEMQQTISKIVEKFESMTLEITQLKQSLEQTTEKRSSTTIKRNDSDLLNHLFVEQKKFLIDTIEQQQKLWSERLQLIVRSALFEQKSSSVVTNTGNTSSSSSSTVKVKTQQEQTTDHLLHINQTSSNSADQHLFKLSIKSPEPVSVFAKLFIAGIEYPRKSHTLCQQDPSHSDEVTCYIAPPAVDGPYNVIVYAKTRTETAYRAAISMRIPGPNITQSVFFPYTFPSFEMHQCILIQPLQSFLRHNEHVLIQMVIPDAHAVKIYNGNDAVVLDDDDFTNGKLKKQLQVCGDVYVYGQWKNETDSPICFFYVI
ncbi:unnamed protein product [Rotaria sp. Silwood2]|nr:unnamed protein product [Rotaria sp. Silwood2]CAF3082441.1 unnamed protein product [Rotaria sp. Silwood2]CAF3323076.1 unnamed protein product [Rotaria sp. Silwood2]CAF3362966.1 unnamed protein product [Rotaria sp. Silwood2]CAF4196407.1 unnamed protein product [Rotaria sp. Silwood2]